MRRLGLAVMAALVAACSQAPAPRPPGPPGAPGGLADGAAAAAEQTLYRVRYEGPEGAGGLRLVMRRVAADRFQLLAADTFGRAAWGLDVDGERALLLDHRERQACVAGRELRIPELALRSLPLPAVARVLAGETPLPPPPGADPADWTDAAGQRWTARREDGELVSWMLWQSGEPSVWWSRQGSGGGVLSHRDGSQFRWREAAREDLQPGAYRRLEAPAGYQLGRCREAGEPS